MEQLFISLICVTVIGTGYFVFMLSESVRGFRPQYPGKIEPLPTWAIGKLNGEYMTAGAGLATRDGRRMGNAFVYELTEHKSLGMLATVITDMGSEFKMTGSELREAFYAPIWLMDCAAAKACRIQSLSQD